MAKLGDLVVNIGANTKDLNKKLGKVRREMRSMGSNFTAVGQSMTRSLSLPLLAIGAAAIKSSSDLETLETSFISLTGGAEQAADMMQQLNDFTAKTPFQIDAVANSARQLIASGTEISQVNEQLQFLGDIAATSGSSINDIAAIFSKVNAKGKVELESLNQLAERGIPIFKALSDATGLPAEKLGAGRVSVEQFNAVLKSFAEEGGFAAGAMERLSETAAGKFSTAMDNLKLAGAELVESLMPALKGGIDKVTELAQRFTSLSDKTQKTILVFGAIVATLGPLLILIPKLIAGFVALRGAVVAFNIALASNPIGLAAVAISGLVAAVVGYNLATAEAVTETRNFADELGLLSLAQKKQQIEFAIQSFDAGPMKASLDELERLEAEFAAKRLKTIGEQGGFVNSQEKKNMRNRINVLKDFTKDAVNETKDMQQQLGEINAKIAAEDSEKRVSAAAAAVDSIENLRKKVGELKKEVDGAARGSEEQIDALARWRVATDELNEATKIFKKTLEVEYPIGSLGALNEQLSELRKELDSLIPGTQAFLDKMAEIDALEVRIKVSTEDVSTLLNSLDEVTVSAESTESAFASLGQSIASTFVDAIFEAESFGQAVKTVLKSVVKGLIAEAIANAITNASSSKNLANQASGGLTIPAFIAAAVGSVKAAFSNLPALAEGGLAFGETLSVVGDNKNAAIDPEVIAPLSKLRDMMGGGRTNVYGRISGDDIVISNDRATRDRNRYT